MLKDRQYSLIYIIGVALSMALVSSVLIFMVMMLGNVYPESHRGRTMLLTSVYYNDADGKYFGSTSVPDDLVRLIREAEPEGLEAMSVIRPPSICADVLVSSGERAAFYANVRYVVRIHRMVREGRPLRQRSSPLLWRRGASGMKMPWAVCLR